MASDSPQSQDSSAEKSRLIATVSHAGGEFPLREVSNATGEALAETILIYEDLKSSFSSMKIWMDRYAERDDLSADDRAIALSLFRDAVVQFVGCFGANPPKLQVDQIYRGETGADGYFKWLKDIRDSFAAHSFGALRQCVVGVFVDHDGNVVGNGHFLNVYQGPQKDGLPTLLAFIGIAVKKVEGEIGALGTALLDSVSPMSSEERLGLPVARTYGTDPSEVRTTRARLKAKRGKSAAP